MKGDEFGIIVVGALAGWWVISWVFDRHAARRRGAHSSQAADPARATMPDDPAPPVAAAARAMTVAELAAGWWTVLGVDAHAAVADIDAAYHRRLADLEARCVARQATDAERAQAVRDRRAVEDAYAFIRAARRASAAAE